MRSPAPEPTIASLILLSLYNDLGNHRPVFDQGLRRFGIDVRALHDPQGLLSLRGYVGLLEWLAEALEDPWLGLRLGSRAGAHALGALGYLFLCSRTLETAFHSASQYLEANQTASTLHVSVHDDLVRICYRITDDSIAPRRQDSEYSTAITWRYMKLLCKSQCRLVQVRFEHEPVPGPIYRRVFNAPVLFGQESNELVLPLEDYRRWHSGLDPHLLPILEEHISHTLTQSNKPKTFTEIVNNLITEQMLSNGATAALVAERLNIAPVTLHRRLRSEGSRFKDLVDSRSKAVARRLLLHTNLPMATISRRLGYSDPATFSRAFRRWFGRTPREFRRIEAAAHRPAAGSSGA